MACRASLSQLRNFIALAEAGSFTAAAKLAHRSQAAFSRSIAELEKAMGAVLVDRIGHKNELTPLGHVVLEHARHIAADADALERAVRVRAHAGADLLRVGMSSTPLALLAQPLLSLRCRRPGRACFRHRRPHSIADPGVAGAPAGRIGGGFNGRAGGRRPCRRTAGQAAYGLSLPKRASLGRQNAAAPRRTHGLSDRQHDHQ